PAAALGKTTPQAMASFVVAMGLANVIYNGAPDTSNPLSLRWAVAALIAEWGIDQLKNNAVTITLGKDAVEFIKQPDGTYAPPAGAKMTLTKPSGYQLQMRHGNTFNFDATHKQISTIVDPYGKAMTFNYISDTDRRLNTVVDCWGSSARTLTFAYDTITKILKSVSDSTGRSNQFTYVQNNLTAVTDPESKVWTYQ